MVKKLTKHGNSLALVLDRGVLDLLEIDADTRLRLPRGRRSSRRHWRKATDDMGRC
jgi:hypothetical protein